MCGLPPSPPRELPWSQRFFLPLRGSGSLILCREKSRKSSVTGVLNSPFFTCHWNSVDFPVCRFGYKKLIITRLVQLVRLVLASRPGGVETLLAASCYRASRLQGFTLIVGGQGRSQLSEPISSLEQISRFRILQIRTGPS